MLVDGCRLPFAKSQTIYNDLMSYDLAREAIKGLLAKSAVDPNMVDYVVMGTVIQDVTTSNIAREAALGAGIPKTVPAHTVTQACISSSQAICTGVEKILSGQAHIVIAGGSETFSDVPIRFSLPMRKKFLLVNKTMKAKGMRGVLQMMLKGLKLSHLTPVAPAIKNFHTQEVMGHSSDRLAARFNVSREEQDQYAVEAHQKAAAAHAEGVYRDEIIPFRGSREENGINAESTLEKLSTFKPAFIKPHGTHTAANSSFLTDGSAATLLMSEAKAKELGYTPRAAFKDWTFVAVDPFEDLLLGPAFAIQKILEQNNLKLSDIDHFEIHEAFAGQVLSNLNALEEFGVGTLDRSKLNIWGGSLTLGHPFGATGSRLANTAATRLERQGGQYALIAACADSGLAHACIMERV